jgi:hypothetical protein
VELAQFAEAAGDEVASAMRRVHAELAEVADVFGDAVDVELADGAARDAHHALAIFGDQHLRERAH